MSDLDGATEPGPPNVEWTPETFAARWNAQTPEARAEWLAGRRRDGAVAERCWMMQHEHQIEQAEGKLALIATLLDRGMTDHDVMRLFSELRAILGVRP